jgi:hypothetical protein
MLAPPLASPSVRPQTECDASWIATRRNSVVSTETTARIEADDADGNS